MNLTFTTATLQNKTGAKVELEHNYTAAAIVGVFAIVLAFENYLLLFAVSTKKLRRIPEILIFWLALSSIVNTLTTLTINVYHRVVDNEGEMGIDSLCKVQFWFANTLRVNDIFTTTLMSIDRFLAITKPFLYRTRARSEYGWISVLASFIISGMISCLPFVGFGRISRVIPSVCLAQWDSGISILIVGIAYIQFAIVLWCYIAIFWSIRKLVKRQKAMAKSQEITYDSPSLNRKGAASPALSQGPSCETSSTSLELPTLANQASSGPMSLRIKAAVNRTLSNYEGAQSESFGLSKQDINLSLSGSATSLRSQGSCSVTSVKSEDIKRKRSATSPTELSNERPLSEGNLKRGSFQRCNSTAHTTSSLKPSIYQHINSIRGRLHDSFVRRKRQASVKRQWKESEHFAKVMGVIVLLFYISWLPLAVSITMTLIVGMTPFILNMTYFSLLMTLGGPLLIPIVYGVMAKTYRAGYQKAIHFACCCGCGTKGRCWSRKIHVN